MIYFVTGKIGGGKTLLMLTKILEHLGKGGCVVSNIALDEYKVDEWLRVNKGRRLVDGQILRHDFELEPEVQNHIPFGVPALNVMVVCDEAQLYYNQANSSSLQSRLLRLVSFLTQSRKCNVDIWFVTQHDTTVWAQFRHQALFGYKCRDMRVVSLPFIGQVGSLGLTWVKYDILSEEIMERGRTPLSKDLFGLYDTRQMYDRQMTELQANARVWHPVDKKARGKYETDTNSRRVHWWARLLGLKGVYLLPRESGIRESCTGEGQAGTGSEGGTEEGTTAASSSSPGSPESGASDGHAA